LAEAGFAHFRDPYGNAYVYLRIQGGGPGKGGVRKDRKLNPINSDFDLYSIGKDGETKTQLDNKDSLDDIVRANDGGFVGLAANF
jgi:general secretion pathway protein G